jgi:hypothetical protein
MLTLSLEPILLVTGQDPIVSIGAMPFNNVLQIDETTFNALQVVFAFPIVLVATTSYLFAL